MHATLPCEYEFVDADNPNGPRVKMPAGRYEIECIPNPVGYEKSWLVFKGTKIGLPEGAWRDFGQGELSENYAIVISE